jgi:signal transduction histidine kinase
VQPVPESAVISTRVQFFAAFAATVAGIVGLAWYGFHSLDQVAEGATSVRREFNLLRTTARIEDTLRDLGAGAPGRDAAELERGLDPLLQELRAARAPAELGPLFTTFQRELLAARAKPSAESWFKAGEAIGAIEESLIRTSRWTDTEERAGDRARRLLLIGGVVVAIFGGASAVVYVRMRREQFEAQEHLRRSDRLAALGTVAASVAHEINNPLATISGCATAVRDRMRKRPDACADSLEYLEMIEDETRRCSGIVKSLGDLAREGPPAMAPADLPKLAKSVVALLEMDRSGKPVAYAVLGEARLEAICDPDKVKQLLFNLLINARDASERSGRVSVTVERAGDDAARLVVADEGRGIERRDLQRIFEPFHTDKTQGLGIGLFLCERIAEQHGGTIRAQSEGRGKGARFVVEFPTRTAGHVPADAVS